jgi:hypothetical protein
VVYSRCPAHSRRPAHPPMCRVTISWRPR